MHVLEVRKEAEVSAKIGANTYQIYTCESSLCNKIIIVGHQHNNSNHCRSCQKKNWEQAKSEKNAEENRDKRVAPNSNTPWGCLKSDEQSERAANRTVQTNSRERSRKYWKRKFELFK